MVSFSNGTIKMSQGDNVQINIQIYANDASPYEITSTDTIEFSLFEKDIAGNKGKLLFKKAFTKPAEGTTSYVERVVILPSDTQYLANEEYIYNVVIKKLSASTSRETICNGRFFLIR